MKKNTKFKDTNIRKRPAVLTFLVCAALISVCSLSGCGGTSSDTSGGTSSDTSGIEWRSVSYGASVNTENVSIENSSPEKLSISADGSGKISRYATDGVSFIYTELDAAEDNFVLTGTVKVEKWALTNGEDDGFGLMAADSIGEEGSSDPFRNNSYQAIVTKTQYYWNKDKKRVSNTGDEITMKLGVEARSKTGNPEEQKNTQYALDTSCAENGPGTYNIIGNYDKGKTGKAPEGTVSGSKLITEVPLTIVRDNTGYLLSYTDPDGEEHSKRYYDEDRDDLSKIDGSKIYVGMFCARQAEISCSDLSLKVTKSSDDPAAEEREPEIIDPDYRILSADTANSPDYDLIYRGNSDGVLTISSDGKSGTDVIEKKTVKQDEAYTIPLTLREGANPFTVTMAPDKDHKRSDNEVLADPEPKTIKKTITYRDYGSEIYAAPDGSADAKGTKGDPLDIATAFSYAAPGQTVFLKAGDYKMKDPLVIPRGLDGTADQPVKVRVSGNSGSDRAVLDFGGKHDGLMLSGDYWDISGIDVTNTRTGAYGIHLSGSHNKLTRVDTYRNGNTGIHISRESGGYGPEENTDIEDRPSHNLIKNCDSFGNADDAYEDADGFAAQFTAGPDNVFDGCTAYNNADDGWDLYAKEWIGPLGPVTIKNCIAYSNGYLEDRTEAANGNGFKLGGDGMSGGHELVNCIAYANKGTGITSNTCPDITVKNCTSVDSRKQNLSLYTIKGTDTDFSVSGLISAFTSDVREPSADGISPSGDQDESKIFRDTNYFFETGSNKNADPDEVFESTEFDPESTITRDKNGDLSIKGGFLRTVSDPDKYPGLQGASL